MDMMITRYQAGTSREDRVWNELESNSGCRRQIIFFERGNNDICTQRCSRVGRRRYDNADR